MIHRLTLRILAPVLLACGLLIGFAGPALAHDVLVSSDPADGATVDTPMTTVSFTFDQPVQNYQQVITLTGPDGRQYQTGPATVDSTKVSAPVALGGAGAYTAAYRIISADGHPVSGEIRFTVAAGAAGTATGIAPPPGAATVDQGAAGPTGAPTSSGLASWLWILIGAAVLLVATAVVIVVRKPRVEED